MSEQQAAYAVATTPEHPLMTPREAALALRLSDDTVRLLFHQGKLAGFQAGGAIRIRRDAVEALLAGAPRPEPEPVPQYHRTGKPGRPGVLPMLPTERRARKAARS